MSSSAIDDERPGWAYYFATRVVADARLFYTAQEIVTLLYAGYCSFIEAGENEEWARLVTVNDFAEADELREECGLSEKEGIAAAFSFVRDPKNWHAIRALATEYVEHRQLDFTEVSLIIKIADGGAHPAALDTYRAGRASGLAPQRVVAAKSGGTLSFETARRHRDGRRATAYHESGHAVAAVLLGIPFVDVAIARTEPDESGCVGSDVEWLFDAESSREQVNGRITVAYAGCSAEERRTGSGSSGDDGADEASALFFADECLGDLTVDERQLYLNECRAEAEELIAAHWPHVERLANALLARKHIAEAEVRNMVFANES